MNKRMYYTLSWNDKFGSIIINNWNFSINHYIALDPNGFITALGARYDFFTATSWQGPLLIPAWGAFGPFTALSLLWGLFTALSLLCIYHCYPVSRQPFIANVYSRTADLYYWTEIGSYWPICFWTNFNNSSCLSTLTFIHLIIDCKLTFLVKKRTKKRDGFRVSRFKRLKTSVENLPWKLELVFKNSDAFRFSTMVAV